MSRRLTCVLVALVLATRVSAQEPTATPEKRSWLSRLLNPFQSSNPAPEYKDSRLRGLVLELKLSPQPMKLSEVRQLQVNTKLTNVYSGPWCSLSTERASRLSPDSSESLHHLVDNHAFEDKPGTVLSIPPNCRLSPSIATRDLLQQSFHLEVSFLNFRNCASGRNF